MNEQIKVYVPREIFDACLSHREGLPKPAVRHERTKHPHMFFIANLHQAIDIAVYLREFATRADTAVAWRTLEHVETGIVSEVL